MSSKRIGLALSCMDYRLFDKTVELLHHDCDVDGFDYHVLAGGSLGYNQNKYECWHTSYLDHVDLAIKLHDIQTIVVVDHMDCGAYKLLYPELNLQDNPILEKRLHIENIEKFINSMKYMYPQFNYNGYLLDLNGNFIELTDVL